MAIESWLNQLIVLALLHFFFITVIQPIADIAENEKGFFPGGPLANCVQQQM